MVKSTDDSKDKMPSKKRTPSSASKKTTPVAAKKSSSHATKSKTSPLVVEEAPVKSPKKSTHSKATVDQTTPTPSIEVAEENEAPASAFNADAMLEEAMKASEEGSELGLVDIYYQLWWRWADFSLEIKSPLVDLISPPAMLEPEELPDGSGFEFVYVIQDAGNKLSTSKGEELFSAGLSMCKLYFTIEKIIYLLVERLKASGIDTQQEVQVLFSGHELAQRKAFESVINLNYNVVVSNFDPGTWGERYLEMVKAVSARGYGYPSQTPRTIYRQSYGTSRLTQTK